MGINDGLDELEMLEIIGEVANGLIHLHLQEPSIAHRDIKLENILKGSDGKWKLCDLGSSSSNHFLSINSINRDPIQEEIEKTTTPLYRAPE